ncbi:DUF86 domain-containing protein [Thermococcus sp. M39]|uniref:type VII toxin-antitoxin system HepT family RNase toxin n=1 Tax=Thermococcus sp. M39 TaxID=1638262 RepID=UPI00143BE720|nr:MULTISPECIES: HepT-like ribonuclease domain-containing protein [unclassified Thermococcus]NJE07559.1 DUF86 domain-containing protein [Thermococcus sp. M39]NJE12143.1 DUF86 domain-containing protein [Thermococcus sp. LS2]
MDSEIRHKIELIDRSLKIIRENLPTSLEDFLKMGLEKDGIYKQLEFAIQNVLDICNEINSSLELSIAVGYDDVVGSLYNAKIIDDELREKLDFLIQLREVLIYNYHLIQDEIAFKNMPEYLAMIGDFLAFTERFLEGQKWRES